MRNRESQEEILKVAPLDDENRCGHQQEGDEKTSKDADPRKMRGQKICVSIDKKIASD